MAKRLNIIIFDGSLNTTPFINRLAEGLSERHQVTILGFSSALKNKISNVQYVSLGSSSNLLHLMKRSVIIGLKYLFARGALKSWIRTKLNLFFLRKDQLKVQNFKSSIALIQPDIIHVQWPSLLPWIEQIDTKKNNIVLSQRGYQNNVRPFVDKINFEYLQTMYPKIVGFHSVSKEMSEAGNRIYKDRNKIDEVVYSGFDFDQLPFRKTYKKNPRLNILSIGRPHWIKGYSNAIQCCRILKEQNVPFNYTIVGAENNEELLYLIHEYGLENDIELTAKVSQEDVYNLMNENDVLLLPSVKEGLPNVVVEAMAVGIPVIATDCGGVANLLANGIGDVIPNRDPNAMANAVIQFLKRDAIEIESQRTKARAKVESQHNIAKMVIDMEALYLKCMESVSE